MTTIIERPYEYNFSANEIRYVLSVSDPAAAGCAVEVELYYETLVGAPVLLYTLTPLTPNSDGTIYCDVKGYLKPLLKYELPPANSTDKVFPVVDQVKKFFIKFRQVTDALPDPGWTDDSTNKMFVLLGGVEQIKFRRSNFFVSFLEQNRLFLTWQPGENKFVHLNQRHYLTFLRTEPSPTLKIGIQVFYTDGSSNISSLDYTVTDDNILFRVKSGAIDLGLPAINPGKKIHHYDLYVTDENSFVVANPYRFYIDYRPVYEYWDLLYFNSLGGIDFVRVKGDTDWQVDVGFDDVGHIPYKDVKNTDRPQAQLGFTNVVKRDIYKGDAGWNRSKQEQEAMVEMLLHPVYEIIDDRWILLKNLKKTQDLRNTKDKKWSFPLEWTYGYEDAVFTPKKISLGVGDQEDVIGGSCIPVAILPSSLPNGQVGQQYGGPGVYIYYTGTQPVTISNITKPSWLSLTLRPLGVRYSGIPDQAGQNITISFTLTNCSGATATFTDTINITAASSGGTVYQLSVINHTGHTLQVTDIYNEVKSIGANGIQQVDLGQQIAYAADSSVGTGIQVNFYDVNNVLIPGLTVDLPFAGNIDWAYGNSAISKIEFTLTN